MARVGTALRSARERAGWSREALAYHSGLSLGAIAQIESGRRRDVRLGSLVALAGALGVSVDYLVGGPVTVSPALLEHRALIYRSDDEFLSLTVPFVAQGIAREEGVLVVTTAGNIALLRNALGDEAASAEFHTSEEWYSSPEAALSAYRVFVTERFEGGAAWIRIVGEPVWAGRSTAQVAEWSRYESIINLVFASFPATIICPYDARSVPEEILTGAQGTHPEIARSGEVFTSPMYRAPEDFLLNPR
jgi:transcriptional regulator with XRE-family HTH domain